ncbi:MAG: hypothetical protein GX992_03975 [Clostridium sp.]|nr:hypothetical protein [Clostridium sp.]
MKYKRPGILAIVLVVLIVAFVLFQNFVIFSGYYYCKDKSGKAVDIFEKTNGLKIPPNSKVDELVLNKALIISKGFLFSKIEVPSDKVNELILGISCTYRRLYTEKRDNLKGFAEVDRKKEPNLMGESYEPNIDYEKVISQWKNADNASIDYVVKADANELQIYVSKDKNGNSIVYLQKVIYSLSDIQNSHIFRKWF